MVRFHTLWRHSPQPGDRWRSVSFQKILVPIVEVPVEDITGLGKIADSALANKVYDDSIAKAARESGDALLDVAKTFRLFLAPFQMLAIAQDRLSRFCERVRSTVPPERQIEAAPSIAGPVLAELRYAEEDSPITDLYLNLLRRAIDRSRVDEAHPAFLKIIGQLSPDEAMILRFLSSEEIHCIEYREKPLSRTLRKIHTSNYPVPELQCSNRLSMYLEHLEFLNLVYYGVGTSLEDGNYPNDDDCYILGSSAALTQFGEMFVKACEP